MGWDAAPDPGATVAVVDASKDAAFMLQLFLAAALRGGQT